MPKTAPGFTLVELLLVMVVLGVLATIVIPKFAETREKAFVSSMKADLRNLATAQESYYSNGSYRYEASLSALGFEESEGVSISVGEATSTGWSAWATHTSTSWTCAIYTGDADLVAPATVSGVVACAQ